MKIGCRSWLVAICILVTILIFADIAPAQKLDRREVDLLLVLAVDVSESINRREAWLQRFGHAEALTDPNFRIFVEHSDRRSGLLHVMNRDGHWQHTDPYQLFDTVVAASGTELSAEHAFYLGYELAKAHTALTLGKRYVQDQALSWGWLTVEETSAVHRRRVGEGQ